MNWKRFWDIDVQAQVAIFSLYVMGVLVLLFPHVVKDSKLITYTIGAYLMMSAITLAAWFLRPERTKKKRTYEDLLGLAEKPKNRWGRE